jgi:catechol 2,3-dioxygenase-like lactoylglutathione lyase family enzyme
VTIRSIHLNVANIERSVEFYTDFLGLVPVGVPTADRAELDAVTATITLHRIDAVSSAWEPDDLQTGFRHVGFKVSDLDALVARLRAAGTPFHLDPLDAEGGVRITFFYDPDGVLLELVEGPLQYHEVLDTDAVEKDWALGDPARPRFDHVAETVADLAATEAFYRPLGYVTMAGIHQPHDPRGFEIAFLRSGDSSLEIFSFNSATTRERETTTADRGFLAVELERAAPADAAAEARLFDGRPLIADPDGMLHIGTPA